MLIAGTVLQQRYEIIRPIGQGGVGAVYEAKALNLKSRVAIKQLLLNDPQVIQAFQREAHMLGNLRHPSIPRILDHFSDPAGHFLVMDYIPGPDLEEQLKQRGGPFPVQEVLRWADQLLASLEYLHTQKPPILHRDIKPSNMKVMPDGTLMLLDFGLAKGSIATTQLTHSASIRGYTPLYAPLEQIQGTGTSERSDLYAVAATLYHLMVGTPAPNALTRAAAVLNGQSDPLEAPHVLNPAIPQHVSDVLVQTLSIAAHTRPSNTRDFRAALTSAAAGLPSSAGHPTILLAQPGTAVQTTVVAPPPGPVGSQWRRKLFFTSGLIGILLAVIGVIMKINAAPTREAQMSPSATPTTTRATHAPALATSTMAARNVVPTQASIAGEITILGWISAMDTMRNSGVLEDFQAAYPNVRVTIRHQSPTDSYQNLVESLASGSGGPDIALIEDGRLAQVIERGGLMDLTDKVTPYLDKINDYKWVNAAKQGKYYAMPWDSGPVVLYYRRDVFKAAGLPDDSESVSAAVATWDKYLATCKTIKEQTGSDCVALNKENNTADLYQLMLWQQGIGYYNDSGEITVDSPQNIATLEKLGEFWQAGVVSNELEWTDPWYSEMASEDKPVASVIKGSWMGIFLKSWIAQDTTGKWGVALMPAMQEGQTRAANEGGSSLVITEQSSNKEAAWAFLEFTLGRETSQLKLFKVSDFLPSLETTYNDPMFRDPDPYFDGQMVRQTYAETAKNNPKAYIYGPSYVEMKGFVATAIQKYATGSMSADEALNEAANSLRAQR